MTDMTVTPSSQTITSRELSRRTGEVLNTVATTGTPVTVTLNGTPRATIVPVPQRESRIDQMIRQGRIRLPRTQRAKGEPLPRLSLPDGVTTDQILADDRADSF